MNILDITQLGKQYGKLNAVRQLSLQVPKGSIFGLLGPNGSGKTTTLAIVLGVVQPSYGSYHWFEGEAPIHTYRQRIGALLETPNFYPYLSGRKNLEIVAEIKQVPFADIDRVLQAVDLSDRQHSKFKAYSLGMKQRLAIAAALLGDPEVLVLDEPTNGLDPRGIADVRALIQREAAKGKTVLLASHIMDEVEKVCTHVAVLKKGELLAVGALSDLLAGEAVVELATEDMAALLAFVQDKPHISLLEQQPDRLRVSLAAGYDKNQLSKDLMSASLIPTHFSATTRSLEALFLDITN